MAFCFDKGCSWLPHHIFSMTDFQLLWRFFVYQYLGPPLLKHHQVDRCFKWHQFVWKHVRNPKVMLSTDSIQVCSVTLFLFSARLDIPASLYFNFWVLFANHKSWLNYHRFHKTLMPKSHTLQLKVSHLSSNQEDHLWNWNIYYLKTS